MAIQITGITDESRQRHILLVNDEEITLTLNFFQVSEFWTFDVSWRGETFYGFMMSLGILHIRALNWPFDFFVSVTDKSGMAPFRLGDFAEGRCELYFVTEDEMQELASGTSTFPEVPIGNEPPVIYVEPLFFDGTWLLDGTYYLNGEKVPA